MPEKKIPLRRCVGCNEHKPKRELIRVVHQNDGSFAMDITGKKNGRGAYICNSLSCLQAAHKKHALERSFSCQIPETIYAQLEEELLQSEQ